MLSSLSLVTEAGRAMLVLFLSSRSARAASVNVGDGYIRDMLAVEVSSAVGKRMERHPEALRSKNAIAFFVFKGDPGASCMEIGGDGGGVTWSITTSWD